MVLVAILTSALHAQDEDPVPLKRKSAEATAPSRKEESKADKKLFEGLVGESAAKPTPGENPLEEAVKGMRSAEQRLGDGDTGSETREIQEEIVTNIQKLIDLAQNQQSRPPQQPNQDQPPPDQRPRNSKDPKSKPEEKQEPNQAQPKKNQLAKESTEEERQAAARAAERARRRQMINDVWGHLPPSVRKQLLSMSGDKYLQKYEDLARRYFEALAEQDATE